MASVKASDNLKNFAISAQQLATIHYPESIDYAYSNADILAAAEPFQEFINESERSKDNVQYTPVYSVDLYKRKLNLSRLQDPIEVKLITSGTSEIQKIHADFRKAPLSLEVNMQLAEHALKVALYSLSQPANVLSPEDSEADIIRRLDASGRSRDHTQLLNVSGIPINDYNSAIIDLYQGGNCGELATLAFSALVETDGVANSKTPVYQVYVDLSPEDKSYFLNHMFTVIGQPLAAEANTFPSNFAAWDEKAVICDPWINVVCRARDYPQKWHETMVAWEKTGKKIVLSSHPSVEKTSEPGKVRLFLGGINPADNIMEQTAKKWGAAHPTNTDKRNIQLLNPNDAARYAWLPPAEVNKTILQHAQDVIKHNDGKMDLRGTTWQTRGKLNLLGATATTTFELPLTNQGIQALIGNQSEHPQDYPIDKASPKKSVYSYEGQLYIRLNGFAYQLELDQHKNAYRIAQKELAHFVTTVPHLKDKLVNKQFFSISLEGQTLTPLLNTEGKIDIYLHGAADENISNTNQAYSRYYVKLENVEYQVLQSEEQGRPRYTLTPSATIQFLSSAGKDITPALPGFPPNLDSAKIINGYQVTVSIKYDQQLEVILKSSEPSPAIPSASNSPAENAVYTRSYLHLAGNEYEVIHQQDSHGGPLYRLAASTTESFLTKFQPTLQPWQPTETEGILSIPPTEMGEFTIGAYKGTEQQIETTVYIQPHERVPFPDNATPDQYGLYHLTPGDTYVQHAPGQFRRAYYDAASKTVQTPEGIAAMPQPSITQTPPTTPVRQHIVQPGSPLITLQNAETSDKTPNAETTSEPEKLSSNTLQVGNRGALPVLIDNLAAGLPSMGLASASLNSTLQPAAPPQLVTPIA